MMTTQITQLTQTHPNSPTEDEVIARVQQPLDGWMRTKLGIPYYVNTWVYISQLRGQRNFVLHEA